MSKKHLLKEVQEYSEKSLEPKAFIPGKTYIPVSGPSLNAEDITSVVDATLDFWFTEWKRCAAFGRALARAAGKKFVNLCNSGSSANLLAVSACAERHPKEKYIVTCAVGFATTVSPIYQSGKIPLYVDIDPNTLSPRIDQVMDALARYKKEVAGAILAHNLGFPFNEIVVADQYRRASKFMIADCCDALGADILGEPVGSYSDISTYSFFPAHIITAGEGGAICTNSDVLHKLVDSYASWGRDCRCQPGQNNVCGKRFDQAFPQMPVGYDHKYTFARLGYNLHMTEWQGALGLSQIQRLHDFVLARQMNHADLFWMLGDYLDWLHFVDVVDLRFHPVPFGFPIRVLPDAPFTSRELAMYLEGRKIGTRPVFGGNLTRQPGFANLPYVSIGNFRGANAVMEQMFWISTSPALTEDHINYIRSVFRDFFKEKGLVK